MDISSSQSTHSRYYEDFKRNSNLVYDQKLNQFTVQQIEIYIQSQVKLIFY
jgi:hypothetical protein